MEETTADETETETETEDESYNASALFALRRMFDRDDDDVSQKDTSIYGPGQFKVETGMLSENDRTALKKANFSIDAIHCHADEGEGEDADPEAYLSVHVEDTEADE